ncbi:hypothetical protein [Stutzerimonas azotifigens]|uniref:Uncharacterized protein n=1 Tax=Stutzerimonas azotifigens TaxID=291995 RepID=A0ABR5Z4M8_9GAMM|nr:hypothetical protein [Stutzerimonas azotifigens]MBA1275172.1 hypothetical protein [Stutzerimonas azotifigens]
MTSFSSRFFFVPLLMLVFILHFQVLGEGTHNPYGIRPLTEMYLAACILLAIFAALARAETASPELRILTYYAVYTCAVFIVLPAIFSNMTFGQPLVYGFIEERRVLFCLGFLPLLLLSKRLSTLQFERAFLYAALVAVFLSWCFKFGVIPDQRTEQVAWDRPDRSSIGAHLMCLAYFYCIQIWSIGASPINGAPRNKNFYLLVAVILLLTLVFATQTRQLIFMCLCFTLFCLRAKAVIWAAALCVLLSPFYFYPVLLEVLGLNIEFYSSQLEGVEDNVRSNTIGQIMAHLDLVNWLPSGSLSLMWQDGFIPYFGEHFFLSDVGVIGTLFRFGFLVLLVVPLTLFLYQRIAKRICKDTTFLYPTMLAFFVIWPLSGLLEYNQASIAMLFVIQSLKARHLRSKEPAHERRTYPQLQGSY